MQFLSHRTQLVWDQQVQNELNAKSKPAFSITTFKRLEMSQKCCTRNMSKSACSSLCCGSRRYRRHSSLQRWLVPRVPKSRDHLHHWRLKCRLVCHRRFCTFGMLSPRCNLSLFSGQVRTDPVLRHSIWNFTNSVLYFGLVSYAKRCKDWDHWHTRPGQSENPRWNKLFWIVTTRIGRGLFKHSLNLHAWWNRACHF